MRGGNDLYIFQMARTGDVKVGRSSQVDVRMSQVQTGCPHQLRLILHAPDQGFRERELHQELRLYRCRMQKGEWFTERCLGELPTDLHELIPVEVLEDPDWWMRRF